MSVDLPSSSSRATILRPFRTTDSETLAEIRLDRVLQRELGRLRFDLENEDPSEWIERATSDSRRVFLVIADRVNSEPVGFIQLFDWVDNDPVVELGIAVHRRRQGRGFGRQALILLFDWLGERGKTTLTLKVLESNERARALYSSLGFIPIGTVALESSDEKMVVMRLLLSERSKQHDLC